MLMIETLPTPGPYPVRGAMAELYIQADFVHKRGDWSVCVQ